MTGDHHPFKGQVVLITGAAQGLGKASALAFASRGAAAALVDVTAALLNATPNEWRREGGQCAILAADITAPGAAPSIVQKTLEVLGRLDILINNAAAS